MQELYKKAQQGGDDALLRPREPLEVQLETLAMWYTSAATRLRTFKARFRSMGCSLLASADRDVFQVGVYRQGCVPGGGDVSSHHSCKRISKSYAALALLALFRWEPRPCIMMAPSRSGSHWRS